MIVRIRGVVISTRAEAACNDRSPPAQEKAQEVEEGQGAATFSCKSQSIKELSIDAIEGWWGHSSVLFLMLARIAAGNELTYDVHGGRRQSDARRRDKRVRVLMIILEIGIISYVHVIIYSQSLTLPTYEYTSIKHSQKMQWLLSNCYTLCSYVIIWIRCKYFEICYINTGCKHFN